MSVQVNKGAVKFKSIAQMARALAEKTGEPYNRVYIRLYKRLEKEGASTAFHRKPRNYMRKVQLEDSCIAMNEAT